jgi:hypothetical protein
MCGGDGCGRRRRGRCASAGADALLRVRDAGVVALLGAQEDRLELVHARVREEQRRIVERDDGRRWHEGVPMLLHEEVDELLPNFTAARGHIKRPRKSEF